MATRRWRSGSSALRPNRKGARTSGPANPHEVRRAAVEVGADVADHGGARRRRSRRAAQVIDDPRRHLIDVARRARSPAARRPTTAPGGAPPRAVGGGEDRRRRAARRQHPRRAALAGHGDDGVGVGARRQADRGVGERGRVIRRAVAVARRGTDAGAWAPSASASRMIASSTSTARTGNFPTAVSPDSMIASAPPSTAPAASLTSARVGRGSSRIDSSTCVATMTGTPRAARRAQHLLLDARHVLERHLEAEVAARHHHRVGGVEDLVEPVDRLGAFELGDDRHVGHAVRDGDGACRPDIGADCTKLSATRSTPSASPNARSRRP